MALASMFRPIRRQPAEAEDREAAPADPGQDTGADRRRASRVGMQPVTNTSPSGLSESHPVAVPRATDEEGWLALLEIVFAETGWPDA